MARKLQFKRGTKTNLPTLAAGEPGWVTDEGRLYIGTGGGNVQLPRAEDLPSAPGDIGAAAASHTHAAGDITSGTLNSSRLPTVPISKGGTGATTADAARTALGAAAASHTHTIANITGLQSSLDGKAASSHNHSASNITSGTLPVTRGGTGVTGVGGTDYTTTRFRGSQLRSAETNPTVNGTINWTYE